MTTKTYIAVADNGHDYIDFAFESRYRANSKSNKEDAKNKFKNMTGQNVKIIQTFLQKY